MLPATTNAPRVGPRELKLAMTSSLRPSVALKLMVPTVIADGSRPGEPTRPKDSRFYASRP